jgi:hypothetical protein
MPLELRARRMAERLDQAYATLPPLSRAEYERMGELAACYGAGENCAAELEAARASGLRDRYTLRAAAFTIPDRVAAASALPLGAERTNHLLVALATSEEAEHALRAYPARAADPTYEAPLTMRFISADLQQAIICDSFDLAAGRRAGMAYDASAPVPQGP